MKRTFFSISFPLFNTCDCTFLFSVAEKKEIKFPPCSLHNMSYKFTSSSSPTQNYNTYCKHPTCHPSTIQDFCTVFFFTFTNTIF